MNVQKLLQHIATWIQHIATWIHPIATAVLAVIASVGVIFLISEEADRKADRVQRAWTLLSNVAEFKEPGPDGIPVRRASVGNFGQIDALELLVRDGVSLNGVYLSQFYLERINLRDADLRFANLDAAKFQDADLTGARFTGANFGGATLTGADLTKAELHDATNLTQPQISSACYRVDTGEPPFGPPTLPSSRDLPPVCPPKK